MNCAFTALCLDACRRCSNVSRRRRFAIWEKHGIRQAGFWTTVIGESNNDLTYLLAWESLAEREKRWGAFMADPEWIAARSDSEKDGQIVANISSSFLQPTAFSSVK